MFGNGDGASLPATGAADSIVLPPAPGVASDVTLLCDGMLGSDGNVVGRLAELPSAGFGRKRFRGAILVRTEKKGT